MRRAAGYGIFLALYLVLVAAFAAAIGVQGGWLLVIPDTGIYLCLFAANGCRAWVKL